MPLQHIPSPRTLPCGQELAPPEGLGEGGGGGGGGGGVTSVPAATNYQVTVHRQRLYVMIPSDGYLWLKYGEKVFASTKTRRYDAIQLRLFFLFSRSASAYSRLHPLVWLWLPDVEVKAQKPQFVFTGRLMAIRAES